MLFFPPSSPVIVSYSTRADIFTLLCQTQSLGSWQLSSWSGAVGRQGSSFYWLFRLKFSSTVWTADLPLPETASLTLSQVTLSIRKAFAYKLYHSQCINWILIHVPVGKSSYVVALQIRSLLNWSLHSNAIAFQTPCSGPKHTGALYSSRTKHKGNRNLCVYVCQSDRNNINKSFLCKIQVISNMLPVCFIVTFWQCMSTARSFLQGLSGNSFLQLDSDQLKWKLNLSCLY